MNTTITDPSIPYVGPIHGGKFSPGKVIKIRGLAPAVGYRFNIYLQCGPEVAPRDDVAIQILVKLLDEYISLNSLQHGVWGEEQRFALTVKRNEQFEIIVMCDVNQYKISVNGPHYWELPQRIHHDLITHLAIDGDVSIFLISYELSRKSYSGYGLPAFSAHNEDFEMLNSTTNTPFEAEMRPSLPPGRFSQLPSYEAALNTSNIPSYPTSGPVGMIPPTESSGMPYPTHNSGISYPIQSSATAYPVQSGITYLTSQPYPQAGVQSTGVPLTPYAPGLRRRDVKRDRRRKCIITIFALILCIIIAVVYVIAEFMRARII